LRQDLTLPVYTQGPSPSALILLRRQTYTPLFINTIAITASHLRHLYTSLSPHLTIARISIPRALLPSHFYTALRQALRLFGIDPAPELISILPTRNYTDFLRARDILYFTRFLYIDATCVITYDTPFQRINEGVDFFLLKKGDLLRSRICYKCYY